MILQMDRGEIASTNRQWGRDSDLVRVFANIRQRLLPKIALSNGTISFNRLKSLALPRGLEPLFSP